VLSDAKSRRCERNAKERGKEEKKEEKNHRWPQAKRIGQDHRIDRMKHKMTERWKDRKMKWWEGSQRKVGREEPPMTQIKRIERGKQEKRRGGNRNTSTMRERVLRARRVNGRRVAMPELRTACSRPTSRAHLLAWRACIGFESASELFPRGVAPIGWRREIRQLWQSGLRAFRRSGRKTFALLLIARWPESQIALLPAPLLFESAPHVDVSVWRLRLIAHADAAVHLIVVA
jgi:hypothetical protein